MGIPGKGMSWKLDLHGKSIQEHLQSFTKLSNCDTIYRQNGGILLEGPREIEYIVGNSPTIFPLKNGTFPPLLPPPPPKKEKY